MDDNAEKQTLHPLSPTRLTKVILDSVADGVFTVDHQWRITSFNRAAEEITGVPCEFALGSLCHTIFRTNICETGCALRATLCTNQRIVNKAVYIVRPDGKSVPISISTAILHDEQGHVVGGVETFRDLSVMENIRQELVRGSSFQNIISRNHRMKRIFSILPEVAKSDSTVLIQGPSGTGKELIARALHDLSPRCQGPLITINCGALPDTLLESELFGYKAGAFTDAKKDKPGKFALAEGGTLFLDEIGDVSPALQTRLLRVLQEKVYEPLGDTRSHQADVRVVAATNKDLQQMIDSGRFREDLFYRLSVVEISLPELQNRKEDVPMLANHFLQQLCKLNGKDILGFSDAVLAVLLKYDYPGNVRELKNIVEYTSVLCPGGLVLPAHLPERLISDSSSALAAGQAQIETQGGKRAETQDGKRAETQGGKRAETQGGKRAETQDGKRAETQGGKRAETQGGKLADLEAQHIFMTLQRNNFKRLKTAQELGISKSTLWRKIKEYHLKVE